MQKTICDKCKIELNTNPILQAQFPYYFIMCYEHPLIPSYNVHLCKDCAKKFKDWLNDE